ncbi:MAG: glycosyltransferase [Nitrososphaerota archaeon]
MIPRIIHQIWLQGYKHIPDELFKYHITCKEQNHDFLHIFWDASMIRKMLIGNFGKEFLDLFDSYKVPAQQADFARYTILYIYGGIYLDMDILCRRNLSPFLNNKFFFTARNDIFNEIYPMYYTGVIGAVPRHPLFLVVFRNMFSRKEYSDDIPYSTGTKLFYDSVEEYLDNNYDDLTIVDPKYLHPCGILDDESCSQTCDQCFVVHTNYSSWSLRLKITKFVSKNKFLILIIFLCFIIIFLGIRTRFRFRC